MRITGLPFRAITVQQKSARLFLLPVFIFPPPHSVEAVVKHKSREYQRQHDYNFEHEHPRIFDDRMFPAENAEPYLLELHGSAAQP